MARTFFRGKLCGIEMSWSTINFKGPVRGL